MDRSVRRLLFALSFLAWGAAAVSAVADTEGAAGPRAQADSFLEKARVSLAAGSLSEASDFVTPALELSPDYSEALYLRARIELRDREKTTAAVDDLRRALASASWNGTDPFAARRDLADVLVRTGRFAEAGSLLGELIAHDPSDSNALLLRARLFVRQRDTASLRRVLSTASARFPLVDDFALLGADYFARLGRRAEAQRYVLDQLKVHPDSLPLLLRQAQLAPRAVERTALVERYEQKGGADPLADVIALEAASAGRQRYLSQFVDQGGLSREDLVERVAAAVRGSTSLTDSFRGALAGFTGTRDLDRDGDGTWDERWTFSSGSAVSWMRDANEDGIPEYSATFQGGVPDTFTWKPDAKTELTVTYGTYPFAQSVRETDAPVGGPAGAAAGAPAGVSAGSSRTMFLVPSAVRIPVLAGRAPAGLAPVFVSRPRLPTPESLQRSSWSIEEYGPDGALVRRTELSRGVPEYREEDESGRGKLDHRVWYRNGLPVRGLRDLDGSGRFAGRETWKDGVLISLEVDTDGDGKVDYTERYRPSRMKSWDYNEDGIADSREYPAAKGTIIREFSTALNGVFDMRLTWVDDVLTGVRRGGREVPVTRDAARGIVWIGPPAPAAARLGGSSPEGYSAVDGREYLVFRHSGVTYAEEIP